MVERTKRSRKWTEAETVKFVELYEKEDCLWNMKLKDYKNKDARESAVLKIVQKMNLSGVGPDEVLKKINTIRSTFKQELAKMKSTMTTGASPDDIYVPKVPWFEIANRFLPSVMEMRKTFTNVIGNSNPRKDQEDNNISSCADIKTEVMELQNIPSTPLHTATTDSNDIYINSFKEAITSSPSVTETYDVQSTPSHKSKSPAVLPVKKKLRTQTKTPEHINKAINALNTLKEECRMREPDDEFTHFGRNVAIQLWQLSLPDALQAQIDILNILQQKRLKSMQSNNYPFTPSSAISTSTSSISISILPLPITVQVPHHQEFPHPTHYVLINDDDDDENQENNIVIE